MQKAEALRLIRKLKGNDLHELAKKHGVSLIGKSGNLDKGWAGQVVERCLGIDKNSSRSPNLGSWELKQIPLHYKKGKLLIKETMAITMIDLVNIKQASFENSHLLTKLRRAIIVARIVGENAYAPSVVHKVVALELKDELYEQVKQDYLLVQRVIREGKIPLTGKMGRWVQPRTKGAKGSDSRAFYARREFLSKVLAIDYLLDASKQK